MPIYRRSQASIQKTLAKYPVERCAEVRLAIDFASLLVGPTSGGEAERLTELLLKSSPHRELAERMKEAAERFLEMEKTS